MATKHGAASAGAASAGPRAKRARVPKMVLDKDMDGAMDLVEVSRLVRDLCRQHAFDREAWKQIVETTSDHAKRIDTVEHEMLQVNDEVAVIVDGANSVYQANEKKNREDSMAAMLDCKKAIDLVDEGLRKTVSMVQQEFVKEHYKMKDLIDGLENKFKHVDALLVELGKRDEEVAAEIDKLRVPFLDPQTKTFNAGVQHFSVASPQHPQRGGGAAPGGPAAEARPVNLQQEPLSRLDLGLPRQERTQYLPDLFTHLEIFIQQHQNLFLRLSIPLDSFLRVLLPLDSFLTEL